MISRLSIGAIIWFMLIIGVLILESSAASDKVKLRDVSAITLYKGRMTTGRRASPQQQIKCVGGSAKGQYQPSTVQCTNQGFDGQDVQWKCDADLPHDMEFGAISVSCEGYDYPDDPYVLKGSCGLEYELEYTSGSGNHGLSRRSGDNWDKFGTFIVVVFIIYVIYSMFFSRSGSQDQSGYQAGGPGGPGGHGGSPGGGPGGYPSAPPPYDDTSYGKPPPYGFRGNDGSSCGGNGQGTSGANNGGNGFWSGATWGALGGYLASSYLNSGYTRPRRSFFSDNSYSSSDSYYSRPSTSTSTRSSSGFGGTSRR
ncbi:unnamed protein product [Caenorhabditis angaria]|uniref:Store-operated calcium entry-associated regulatory factor n=1 Tax=Caenorhabditis angaria TaxID=860376 RepID=A0A9P1IBV7_9PELO|nr:unnamed protein product [Caenorhabditis angaria]